MFNDEFLLKPKIGYGIQAISNEKKQFFNAGLELSGKINENFRVKAKSYCSNARSISYGSYGLMIVDFKLIYNF